MTGTVSLLAMCLAGGAGAALRLVIDALIRVVIRSAYPIGTLLINVTGSMLLGLLSGLATGWALPYHWELVIGTGLLGGYTTFSTASVETIRLFEDGRYVAAFVNAVGMLLACIGAAGLGLLAGVTLVR